MSAEEKEIKIIKLNEERLKLIKKLKNKTRPEYEQKYAKRIEQINHEIEELIYG